MGQTERTSLLTRVGVGQGRFKVSARLGLWLTDRHRQQRRDVVHHRLHPSADRLKTRQPQQVECCSLQAGQRTSAIAAVAVGVLVNLGVTDPVPALTIPFLATDQEISHGRDITWLKLPKLLRFRKATLATETG